MTLDCSTVRERLADGELDGELDGAPRGELGAHLAGCEACRAVTAALALVDTGLARLAPIDAPDALVLATLARVRDTDAAITRTEREARPSDVGARALLVASLAALASALGALLIAPFAALRWLVRAPRGRLVFGVGGTVATCVAVVSTMTLSSGGSPMGPARDRVEPEDRATLEESRATADTTTVALAVPSSGYLEAGDLGGDDGIVDGRFRTTLEVDERAQDFQQQAHREVVLLPEAPMPVGSTVAAPDEAERVPPVNMPEPEIMNGAEDDRLREDDGEGDALDRAQSRAGETATLDFERGLVDLDRGFADVPNARSSRWWAEAQSTQALAFQSRDGWWANTYVPGDPALRVLHARLASASTVHFASVGMSPLALAETARPTTPALAAPSDHAVALGVHADVASVDGPSRVRLEVALRAIEQAAGRRGALRVAVVIDARHALRADEQAHVRALLSSLGRARSPRDQVMVVAAGPRGGTLVPLGAMRHGELAIALRRLFGGGSDIAAASESVAPITLEAAMQTALEAVATDEGAGLVMLATPDAAHDAALDRTLHVGAVAGVVTSAIAIGTAASPRDLDAIALAGQGRRRVIASDADAAAAVRAELDAASQLVARALRIRVRLAPGVQLIGVVGSHPLDQVQTARTREAEQAIDRDFARRLGIAADRDEDDDGVRILVPSFYAGDAHVVLLDVMVPGPGAIADIDVRFKDLVRVGNGRASSALSIERGAPRRGPQELRVVASHVGQEVASALTDAGDRAHAGDLAGARARLLEARARIDEVRAALPAIARDRSLAGDAELCDRYLAALSDPSADRALVATSLQYAARRRVMRPQLAVASP